jgi:hypothetical protein
LREDGSLEVIVLLIILPRAYLLTFVDGPSGFLF